MCAKLLTYNWQVFSRINTVKLTTAQKSSHCIVPHNTVVLYICKSFPSLIFSPLYYIKALAYGQSYKTYKNINNGRNPRFRSLPKWNELILQPEICSSDFSQMDL